MKRFIIIGLILLFILFVAIVGSILVTPDNEIKSVDDYLVIQHKLENDYSCYGYTIDNPKIVVNPYKIAPLSALIMFETKDNEKVSVYIKDKYDNKVKLYDEFNESKEHYLDIYNLYSNYDNKVVLVVKDVEYEYVVSTKLDNVNDINISYVGDDVLFSNYGDDLIGLVDNELKYYFVGFHNNVIQLENGHLIVTSSRINNNDSYVGFSEIDMLGRIYNDYIVEDGYYNLMYVMDNGNYLVLSNDVIEIDKQNGKILKRFKVDNNDKVVSISYDKDTNSVVINCYDKVLIYDYKKVKLIDEKSGNNAYIENSVLNINYGNYFHKYNQNRFGLSKETEIYKKNDSTLFYKEKDDVYKDCNIKFKREFDRIIVNKDCDKDIFLILDRFMNKKTYKVNSNEFYINIVKLKGEYIIYVKINDNIYKSGYYVKIK